MTTASTSDERASAANLSRWLAESATTTEHRRSSSSTTADGATARGDGPVPRSPPAACYAPDDDARPRCGASRGRGPGCSPARRRTNNGCPANDKSSERLSNEDFVFSARLDLDAPCDGGNDGRAFGAGQEAVARRRCRSSDSVVVVGSSDYQSREAGRRPLHRRSTMELDHHVSAGLANGKCCGPPSSRSLDYSARPDATTVPRDGGEERADEAGREASARRRCRSSDSFLCAAFGSHPRETRRRSVRGSAAVSSTGWRRAVESSPRGDRGHHSRRVHFAQQGEDGHDAHVQSPCRQSRNMKSATKSKTRIINEVHFDRPVVDIANCTSSHFDYRVAGTADQKMEPGGQSKNQWACGGSKTKATRTRVMNLPWTDRRGVEARYSGEVDSLIRPHGHGTLLYDHGRALECVWNDGMPLWDDERVDPIRRKNPARFHRGQSRSPSCIKELSRDSHRRASATGMPPLPFQPPCYDLEDIGSPGDMIIERDPAKALENVKSLKVHDFAFVRRSDGSWTYAIIANFPVKTGEKASIRFVTNQRGSTKTLERKYWAKFVRLANLRCDGRCVAARLTRKEGGTSLASDDAVLLADAPAGWWHTPRTWRRSTGQSPFRW